MMLDTKQIRVIFLFKFKMGCKAAEKTHKINTFGPGTANEPTGQWWFSFAKEMRALKMRSAVTGHQKLTTTNKKKKICFLSNTISRV